RINRLVGEGCEGVWVATFHASCVRILRRFGDRIGYDTNFTIYDTDDSKTAMRSVCKKLNIDTKKVKETYFLNVISQAKNELIYPEDYARLHSGDFSKRRETEVYFEYQARLKAANAMDFDDLLVETVRLLRQDPEIQEYYHNRLKYIMVDEYQDTNTAQFELVRLLTGESHNLCVVGDDDQSIYKFRGANIYNILNFEEHFPEAKVIKLEENYRSKGRILEVANQVIKNNEQRKEKKLWTEKEDGKKVRIRQFESAYEEAEFIALDIKKRMRTEEASYNDFAVLYRTNAQSRILEEKMIYENIPYRIVGGINFYGRKEIKDILAYLKTVDNGRDDVAVRRILNVPKRGIGGTTEGKIAVYADANHISFYEALKKADEMTDVSRAAGKIRPFVDFIEELRSRREELGVASMIKEILDRTGYEHELEMEKTDEADTRIENLGELYSKAVAYEQERQDPTLSGFLEEVALIADIDRLDPDEEYVLLMTLHGAKGLEFSHVYMAGMEDGLFPSYMSITSDSGSEELEEERRLCYVGITRAMETLTMTMAKARMIRGEMQYGPASRFVKEIPEELKDSDVYEPAPRFAAEEKPAVSSVYKKRAPVKNFGTKIEKKPLDYKEGDRVTHSKFGEGTVKLIVDGGRDYEVTVEFDSAGIKKMFASFARMTKV
ncbi:MAG: UvrD-helicase domain-containing protein, partial [Lachnospiraceae bacterium]|nr:UvrD-helicase domain-containing protein [Lachnospiraceae bacterium]